MNPQQAALYQRIQAFAFEPTAVHLSFVQRLAREHRWSLAYAERALDEYKRFAFLAVAAGHPVTPSEPVDWVWHLHLSYTRSYWEHFCPEVLQTPWHHEPTQGGPAEQEKFCRWYAQTLDSYAPVFWRSPPHRHLGQSPRPLRSPRGSWFGSTPTKIGLCRNQCWLSQPDDRPSSWILGLLIV
ncbi:MAG: hypothetical protein HC918_14570, partial [Oscillatoriales cyanobacterium SM2_1_8]|nr:hypothetical protein [Oscillatoriales cyanobacterium SM2_1_8]